jgi:hypothetical protein
MVHINGHHHHHHTRLNWARIYVMGGLALLWVAIFVVGAALSR